MIRIAVLDLYDGQPNQGMRCIREIIAHWGETMQQEVMFQIFDVRSRQEVPDLSFDFYISSGGPGSPIESEGSQWEAAYFSWLSQVEAWNAKPRHYNKKFVFFICHSFQLICRYLKLAQVTKRRSTAFGVFPVHLTSKGSNDVIFNNLPDPFYVVDSRDWQVIQPDLNALEAAGAEILCIEKERPHVPYERAIMGIRFNKYFVGTQFHPEADATGMTLYLQSSEKKEMVIQNYGEEKWKSMIEGLNNPGKIMLTYSHILPNFLNQAAQMISAA
ncbi:MAG TPA: GMP synthase [Chitinophagaceae bacterium]|nr:GMP synthase [Chitinophagaceae bacterium]